MSLLHGSLCHSRESGNPIIKRYKYIEFLTLKAQVISLFSGSPPTRG